MDERWSKWAQVPQSYAEWEQECEALVPERCPQCGADVNKSEGEAGEGGDGGSGEDAHGIYRAESLTIWCLTEDCPQEWTFERVSERPFAVLVEMGFDPDELAVIRW